MLAQTVVVAALVAGCFAYVLWVLMPRALRRSLAVMLSRQPILARWPPLRRAASKPDGGCGCDGCDKAGHGAGEVETSVVRLVPRVRR